MDQSLLPLESETKSQDVGRFYQYRGVVLVAMLALVLYLNISFLKPLAMGAILATVLFPLMSKFDKTKLTRKVPRTARAAIITIVFLLLILIPFGVLVFAGVQQVIEKIQGLDVKQLTTGNMTFSTIVNDLGLHNFMDRIYEILPIKPEQAQAYITKGLAAAGAFGASVLQDLITSLPATALQTLVMIFTLLFLLIDGPRAVAFIRRNSIFNLEQTDRLINQTALLSKSVIVATVISGGVQGAIVALICFITGTSNVLLFAFLTFLCSFLPVLGTAPVVLFLAAQAFAGGSTSHGIIWLVGIAIVSTSDNFVRPYVIRGGAELHPLIAFVSAFGGLDMIGFYGLFIGPIVAGLFFTLLPMVTKTYPTRASVR